MELVWQVFKQIEADSKKRFFDFSASVPKESEQLPVVDSETPAQSNFGDGSPLPNDERLKTKDKLGLGSEDFYWPDAAKQHFQRRFSDLRKNVRTWQQYLDSKMSNPAFAQKYRAYFDLPKDFYSQLLKL